MMNCGCKISKIEVDKDKKIVTISCIKCNRVLIMLSFKVWEQILGKNLLKYGKQ